MSKVKKQKSKSKAPGSQKATASAPPFETPKDGDRINVAFKGHPDSWWGPLYYRTTYSDPEKGTIEGACALTEDWSEPGKLSLPFKQVEFWSVWDGETSKEYEERKKSIIEDLQRRQVPIDPIDSFIGENTIHGQWSKPKIGPAFKVVPVEGKWSRPNDGDMIEVHSRNNVNTQQGIFFAATDRIYSRSRGIEKAELNINRSEILYSNVQYGKVFLYGVPMLPFAEWVRWRLNEDKISEWQPGPHFEEWSHEERTRRIIETRNANKKLLEDSKAIVRQLLKEETVPQVRLIRLKDMLANAANIGYETAFDTEEGCGKLSRDEWTKFLESEIDILERALSIAPKIENDYTDDDSSSEHGPFSYTVKQLADIAGMTESGVRKELQRENPKIKGVRVYFDRNNDRKHARYSIAESSFEKIKRKVFSKSD